MASTARLVLGLLFILALCDWGAADNVTLCWGMGDNGQLGNGMLGSKKSASYWSATPVVVAGNHSFATICAGEDHSCALEPSGKAWCFGYNLRGALGTARSASEQSHSAVPVEVVGGHTFRSIDCGRFHTCALDDGGKAWCWGLGSTGQLGNGGNTTSSAPVRAGEGITFDSVCAGDDHSCGLDRSGGAWCWGTNSVGQLGAGLDQGNERFYTATQVSGNLTFWSITCGQYHTCALEPPPASQAWCWGSGNTGQLGNGDQFHKERPVAVFGSYMFATLSAGAYHTCGITLNKTLLCWGKYPGNGQNPPYTAINVPTEPAWMRNKDTAYVAISAADGSTCALDIWSDIWCFGRSAVRNESADLQTNDAVKLPGGYAFLDLGSARSNHACAVATTLAATGENSPSAAPSPGAFESSPATVLAPGPSLAASPAPAPVPAPTAEISSSGFAAVPVGAIAGGAAAGAVLLAVLAFFALRPSKGWLRRQNVQPELEEGKTGAAAAARGEHPQGGSSQLSGPAGKAAPGQANEAAAAAAAASEIDTLLPYSVAVLDTLLPDGQALSGQPAALHASPASTASVPDWEQDGSQPASTPSEAGALATNTSSGGSSGGDALISFITSYLGTHPEQTSKPPSAAAATIDGTSRSGSTGGSGIAELHTDARLWEVQWSELTVLQRIGRGSFGSVYLAEWSHTQVAVKVLVSKNDVGRGQLELPERVLWELQAEAAVMSRMRHPNILQFMGLVALPPALITEYCSRGSLYDCLKAACGQPEAAAQLTWQLRLAMAVDAATGLCYLHRRGIIHRDVKSPNLLLDESWRVKVADFNLSKLLEGARPEASLSSIGATNPIWLAPEVMEGDAATGASDVYGFGMVLYELLTWRLPWNLANMTPFKVGAMVRQGRRPEVPPCEALPGPGAADWAGLDAYVQLMRDCWAQLPEDRPSFDAVVGRLRQLLEGTPPASPMVH